MHRLKMLPLAAILASLPMGGMGFEVLDDQLLSRVTAQEGIRFHVDANLWVDMAIEDTTGIPAKEAPRTARPPSPTALTEAGFVTVQGLWVKSDDITVDMEASRTKAGEWEGQLQITVDVASLLLSGGPNGLVRVGVAGSSLTAWQENANVRPEHSHRRSPTLHERGEHALATASDIAAIGAVRVQDLAAQVALGGKHKHFLHLTAEDFHLSMDQVAVIDASSSNETHNKGTVGIQHVQMRRLSLDTKVSLDNEAIVVEGEGGQFDVLLMGVGTGSYEGFQTHMGVDAPSSHGTTKAPWYTIGNLYLLDIDIAGSEMRISNR